MTKFKVEVKEVHIQCYIVDEADNPNDARNKIHDKDEYLIDGDFVYSHTLDKEEWPVTEIKNDTNSPLAPNT